jgi:hypothetical protein
MITAAHSPGVRDIRIRLNLEVKGSARVAVIKDLTIRLVGHSTHATIKVYAMDWQLQRDGNKEGNGA